MASPAQIALVIAALAVAASLVFCLCGVGWRAWLLAARTNRLAAPRTASRMRQLAGLSVSRFTNPDAPQGDEEGVP